MIIGNNIFNIKTNSIKDTNSNFMINFKLKLVYGIVNKYKKLIYNNT